MEGNQFSAPPSRDRVRRTRHDLPIAVMALTWLLRLAVGVAVLAVFVGAAPSDPCVSDSCGPDRGTFLVVALGGVPAGLGLCALHRWTNRWLRRG